jgi:hypothetical protein
LMTTTTCSGVAPPHEALTARVPSSTPPRPHIHNHPFRSARDAFLGMATPFARLSVAKESDTGIEINNRLMEHYGDRATSRSEVYRWIRDVNGRRTDVETISSPGPTPEIRHPLPWRVLPVSIC